MSRTFATAILCTTLAFLAASTVLAADKPPPKKSTGRGGQKRAPAAGRKGGPNEAGPKEKSRPAVVQPLPGGDYEATIERALAMPAQMDFTHQPLHDVVDYLVDYHSQKLGHAFSIKLDTKALNDAGIAPDTPVTMSLRGISLRSALNLMLKDLQLTWIIDDEVLLITTPEEAEARLTTKVLNVADLVVCRDSKGNLWDDYDSLIDAIKSTVLPTTWDDVGGPGSICPGDMGSAKALIISQSYRAHGEVANMLAEPRSPKTPNAGPPVRDKEPPTVRSESCRQAGAAGSESHGDKGGSPDGKIVH